ncbi:MAG: hypothetical protein IJT69_03555, partial [Clostridia bacterium]|nr:hypothetical protein [Clostridia bacterium]
MMGLGKKKSNEPKNDPSLETLASTGEYFDSAPAAKSLASEDAVTEPDSSALSESNGEPLVGDLDECASVPACAPSVPGKADLRAAEENVPSMDEETLRKMMER